MDVYSTEEEQIESIKKWWKENGRAVIAGVVLGLGGILGWQAWTRHQADLSGHASLQFEQLLDALQAGLNDSVDKRAEVLVTDFDGTAYAVLGALADARVKLEQNDNVGARARLQWAVANAPDAALLEIARLRLARILLSEGDLAGAEKLAREGKLTSYTGEYAELEGDIAAARKDLGAAAAAYRRALNSNVSNPATVRMKLDDLAVDEPAFATNS